MSPTLPNWFHPHGMKLGSGEVELMEDSSKVLIETSAARLVIRRTRGVCGIYWLVNYRITFEFDSWIERNLVFSTEQLSNAFLLENSSIQSEEGYFFREGRHLNLTAPGTGRDGDPNLSLYLSDDFVQILSTLINGGQ